MITYLNSLDPVCLAAMTAFSWLTSCYFCWLVSESRQNDNKAPSRHFNDEGEVYTECACCASKTHRKVYSLCPSCYVTVMDEIERTADCHRCGRSWTANEGDNTDMCPLCRVKSVTVAIIKPEEEGEES